MMAGNHGGKAPLEQLQYIRDYLTNFYLANEYAEVISILKIESHKFTLLYI